jgi:hypothetical protein
MSVDEWIDRFAGALGEGTIQPKEMGQILRLARDVAHGVERRLAPLSSFVVGLYVGRRTAEGIPRDRALSDALEAARRLIPDGPAEG